MGDKVVVERSSMRGAHVLPYGIEARGSGAQVCRCSSLEMLDQIRPRPSGRFRDNEAIGSGGCDEKVLRSLGGCLQFMP